MAAVNKIVYGTDTLIDLTADTASEDDVLEGATFHTAAGVQAAGKLSPLTGGYGICATAADTLAKIVEISGYALRVSFVAVKFAEAVPAGATLNVSDTGAVPIYYNGAAIKADVIEAGCTATLVYDGASAYHLISIDTLAKVVQDIESSTEAVPSAAAVKAAIDGVEDKLLSYSVVSVIA